MWVTIPSGTQWCHDGRPAGHALAVRTADKNRPAFRQSGFERIQEGLIELSLVLTGSFGLLLTLQAGADVMLALLHFGDNALLGAAPLKTAQSALQRLVLLDANFRHGFPSLRWHPAQSRMRSGPYTRLVYYIHGFSNCQAGIWFFYKLSAALAGANANPRKQNIVDLGVIARSEATWQSVFSLATGAKSEHFKGNGLPRQSADWLAMTFWLIG